MPNAKRILIIDDDPDFRKTAQIHLESNGYKVLEADTGGLGLEMVTREKPDLVILDVMMESPVEGYTVVHAIRSTCSNESAAQTKIIMVSSIQETPANRFPADDYAALITPDAYFTKPVDFVRLVEMVDKMTKADRLPQSDPQA